TMSTRNTPRPVSAFLVISPPHDGEISLAVTLFDATPNFVASASASFCAFALERASVCTCSDRPLCALRVVTSISLAPTDGAAGGCNERGPAADAEPFGVDPGPAVAIAEERRPGQPREQRLGEQEDDDDVDDGRQAEGEREALHVADREQVERHGGDERHPV